MENLGSEHIEKLRSLFGQMNDSRRQLRPILSDIAASIDKGFFIDADSEEVNQLLRKILDAQQQLSAVEQLKKSVITKRLEIIDKNISLLKQNSKRDETNATLARIETLAVDSEDSAIINAVKKVKLQAEHLRNKSGKLDAVQFDKLAERFIFLANIIDNAENFSSADFISVTNSFPDNPLIAMVLTSKLVHFPKIEDLPTEPEENTNTLIPTRHRLNAVNVKVNKVKPDMNLILTESENFSIQKSDTKKSLSVKSFSNKIHQLFDSVDPLPVFKILIKTRVFFVDSNCDFIHSGKMTKKFSVIIPRLFEKLFDWGIVDKVTWRGQEFYFLNNYGSDLCIRSFTRSAPNFNTDYYESLFHSLQFAFFFLFDQRFKHNFKINFTFSTSLPAARARSADKLYFFFSLILLGKDWANMIATFKIFIEEEIDSDISVFLFGLSKNDLAWIKIFDTVKFKKVPFFMFTCDGLFDQDFNEVDIETFFKFPKKTEPVAIPALEKKAEPKIQSVPAQENLTEKITSAPEFSEIETETSIKAETVEVKPAPQIEEIQPLPEIVEVETATATDKTSEQDIEVADILNRATVLFDKGEKARGMLALNALYDISAQESDSWSNFLAVQVGFILDDPMSVAVLENMDTFSLCSNNSMEPNSFIGNSFDFLYIAASIKYFFNPPNPNSFHLKKLWTQINSDSSNVAVKACPAAKSLLSLFLDFTANAHRAFATSISGGSNAVEDFNAVMQNIKFVDTLADSLLHSHLNHRRVKDLINQLFNYNGLARKYLQVEKFSSAELLNFCRQFSEYGDENAFSDEKIEDFIDSIWNNPEVQLAHKEHEAFIGPKRKKVSSIIKQILVSLTNYVKAKQNLEISGSVNKTRAPADKALAILEDLKKQLERPRTNLGVAVFREFADNLSKQLKNESTHFNYTVCLLGSSYIELENSLPSKKSFGVRNFSLSRRFMEFESDLGEKSFKENLKIAYETALKNYDCGILQDLEKYYLPQIGVSENELKRKITGIERQVPKQIDRIYNDFLNDLELARNYSRITDQEKIDAYINAIVAAKEHFSATKNPGLFQHFVNSCNSAIEKASLPQSLALKKRLDNLSENQNAQSPLLDIVRRQIELMNLTVAEDYLNRLETDDGVLLTNLDVMDSDLTTLEEFLTDYENLFRAVFNAQGSVDGAFRQRIHVHANRMNRETLNSLEFLRGWKELNSGQNPAIESAILLILEHLSYGGGKISAQTMDTNNQKSYTVTFDGQPKIRENYPHPFSVFGTEIFNRGLEIVYLSSNRTAENIAQVLSSVPSSRGIICLLNMSLTLPARRTLAKIMKLSPTLKNIVVIDKVMALYLTRFDDAQRGKKMLQAALPFARVQPYTTGGVIPPEMFIGRSFELEQIRDMTGAVFVYGGRQLGKSALLRQVRSIEHSPANLNFAFFIDLKNLDCTQSLQKIVYELHTANLIGEVETWQDFSIEMHKLLDGQLPNVEKPNKILLLLDESDTFLSSKDSEAAIDILRELLVAFSGQFKFVLAGLHKVIRFEQNSSFGNLNHISVLPFKPADAMELLVKPMSYLGFKITDENLLSAIFSRTNYYPGSIQYYCKMLVDAVSTNYTKQNFDVIKNPPYPVDNDYLKNVLGNRDFQEEINQKFQITLHLDDDNYYEIIALTVALIYYEHGRPVGVEITDIKNNCLMCGVDKITKLTDAELLSLLDEMVALNLLRRTEDGKFEFNRYAFWHMMGTESEVQEKLDSYGLKSNS